MIITVVILSVSQSLWSQNNNTRIKNGNARQLNIEVQKYRKIQATTTTKYIQRTREHESLKASISDNIHGSKKYNINYVLHAYIILTRQGCYKTSKHPDAYKHE
jgi:hypothetical protein